MRVEFLQSIDFNQMLVYSTFAHLLFLTMILLLPSPEIQEQIVVPTFRLDLIELPSTATRKKKQDVVAPPVSKRTVSKPKPIAKKLERKKIKTLVPKSKIKPPPPPKPKLRESETRKKILADLEAFESGAPKKSILKELDEIARTVPKTRVKKVVPPKPMQEETFNEIEKKKAPELPLKPELAKVPPLDEDSGVEAKQRKPAKVIKELDKATQRTTAQNQVKEVISPEPIKPQQTTASELIKELEAIENKKTFSVDTPVEENQSEELNSVSAFKGSNEKPLMSVAEKFKELEESSEEVIMDISQDRMVRKEFKTVIQRDEAPVSEMDSEIEASNALSTYVGKVYKRVYSKWKTPLGSKSKKVVVAFTVFRKGNIDKPIIRESAGDENLDSIAVRAIFDAAPFPPLPKELTRPNLRVSIIFKYVSE